MALVLVEDDELASLLGDSEQCFSKETLGIVIGVLEITFQFCLIRVAERFINRAVGLDVYILMTGIV